MYVVVIFSILRMARKLIVRISVSCYLEYFKVASFQCKGMYNLHFAVNELEISVIAFCFSEAIRKVLIS